MKNFKSLSLIATFTLALLFSGCSGITDANNSEPSGRVNIEAQDLQDILQDGDGEEDMDMVRIRPD